MNNQTIVLNTLGDLTNRENRFASPRFADDYFSLLTGGAGQDGISDDLNDDNVPDLYPTLYPNVFNTPGSSSSRITPTTHQAIALLAFPVRLPRGLFPAPAEPRKRLWGGMDPFADAGRGQWRRDL